MQVGDAVEPVLLLDASAKGLRDRRRQPATHHRQQRGVVAEANSQRPIEGQDPLSVRRRGQKVVDPQRSGLGHASAHARGTRAASLAREGHAKLVAAPRAVEANEPVLEVPAAAKALELVRDKGRQRGIGRLGLRDEGREMGPDDAYEVAARRGPGDVRTRVTGSHVPLPCELRSAPKPGCCRCDGSRTGSPASR